MKLNRVAVAIIISIALSQSACFAQGTENSKEEVKKEVVEKSMPAYKHDLERIVSDAKKGVEKSDKKLQAEDKNKGNVK